MPKITKENAAHMRALAAEARARKKRAQELAAAQAEQLAQTGLIPREIQDKIGAQLNMLASLIAEEIASGAKGRVRLQDLLKAQAMLIVHVKSLRPDLDKSGSNGRPKPVQVRPVGEAACSKTGARLDCGIEATISSVPSGIEDNEIPQLL